MIDPPCISTVRILQRVVLVKTNKLYAWDLVDGDVASDVAGFLYDVDSL